MTSMYASVIYVMVTLSTSFLELLPGADDGLMPEGAVIYDTRDPISLSDLLGKIVFQGNDS